MAKAIHSPKKFKGVPSLLQTEEVLIKTGFGTASANQRENLKYATTSLNWAEIYTVPAGKIWYVSGIITATDDSSTSEGGQIGTGAVASESVIMALPIGTVLSLNIPLKFSGGTRVSVKAITNAFEHFSLIGWEE